MEYSEGTFGGEELEEEDGKLSIPVVETAYDQEVKKRRRKLNEMLKTMDIVPKRTMHEKLRHRLTSRLGKMVGAWMKENEIRGLDYYHFMMLLAKYAITIAPHEEMTKRKKKKVKLFEQKDDESAEGTATESDLGPEHPFQTMEKCMHYIKEKYPDLVKRLQKKEIAREERRLSNLEKFKTATKTYMEATEKLEEKDPGTRMCYLEKKDIKEKKEVHLDNYLKGEGFPVPPPKNVPSEIFEKFGLNREMFEERFPLMDEEDFERFMEKLSAKNESEDDILKRRGRFPFAFPYFPTRKKQGSGEEEEEENVNFAEWEQDYWRRQEDGVKEEEMELCQLMLVRSGTSWRQELGYTEGWRDTTRLGVEGRKNMDEAAKRILNRGYKFDYVLTSTLGRALRTADLMLSASGQENLIRRACWELNPRHQGKLEGQTDLGTATRWGWLPQEWFAFTTPPPINVRDKPNIEMAMADPSIKRTLPRAENIFHVQERTESVWLFVQQLFLEKGKRTILMCAHKDSIEALLFHIYRFAPTDFTAWHPSYTTPIILMWYKCGDDLIPAFIDFLADAEEADLESENLTVCWLERFVDQGVLDDEKLAEIKEKIDKKQELPDIEELWEEKFKKIVIDFESNAETIGQRLRQFDMWLKRGYIYTPEEEFKFTEDNTVFHEFMEHLDTIEKARDPLSDVLTVEERVEWVLGRAKMPLELKLKHLKSISELMIEGTPKEVEERLKKCIKDIEKLLEIKQEFVKMMKDAEKKPRDRFGRKPPNCFGEMRTLDDWAWAARNELFPEGFKPTRNYFYDDLSAASVAEAVDDLREVEEEENIGA